jgi:hypothetical protein
VRDFYGEQCYIVTHAKMAEWDVPFLTINRPNLERDIRAGVMLTDYGIDLSGVPRLGPPRYTEM